VLIQFPGTLHLYGCDLLSLVDIKVLAMLTSLFGCVGVGHALILVSCVLALDWDLFPGLDQLSCAMLLLVQCESFVFVVVQVLEMIKNIWMLYMIIRG
jgi:hypothetical protein